MQYQTLISSAQLAANWPRPDWVVVDCRFALPEPELGAQQYQLGHIAGAHYAHLNRDLSGPVRPGHTGRHPLPDVETLERTLGSWGITAGVQVVAYDASGGTMAARLWLLLRWLGHAAAAVLDGGLPAWQAAGHALSSAPAPQTPRRFSATLNNSLLASAAEVAAVRTQAQRALLDVRSAERFRGEQELLDAVAGHIPGARNAPHTDCLQPDGHFRPAAELNAHFDALLHGTSSADCILYCGSGVTAAHTALALQHAGHALPRVYAGSWSEWITDAARPVATGAD